LFYSANRVHQSIVHEIATISRNALATYKQYLQFTIRVALMALGKSIRLAQADYINTVFESKNPLILYARVGVSAILV